MIENTEKVERAALTQRRKEYIQRAILSAVGIAGILAVAMVAPNALQLIPRISKNKYGFLYRSKTAVSRLAQKGHICFVEKNGKKFIRLTKAGEQTLALETQMDLMRSAIKRRWDHRYRLVMFDIPQRKKTVRDRLRMAMHGCGFLRLQNSVWVYPYDCEELIVLLKLDMRLGKEVIYTIVEKMENDAWVKKHFNLT